MNSIQTNSENASADLFDLSGKRALVTGSARGIGRAIAQALREHGAKVFIHASRPRDGVDIAADLTLEDAPERIYAHTGDVDILVLNASMQIKKPWETLTAEDFDMQMHVNVRASLRLMQLLTPAMKARGWGRVLTIGSVQERKPHPDMLIYSASKAAQTMLTQSLASQLAPFGVTINNLAPGVIDTDRNKEALSDPEYAKIVTGLIPVGFYGKAEDCVGAALLLCSDAGRYITGQSIFADGGKSL